MAEAIGEASENFYRRTAFVKKSAVTAEKRNQIKIKEGICFQKKADTFLCDKPGKRLPCLHEQTFAGQRTANSDAVSCPWYRSG